MKNIEVVAAIIKDSNKILATRRGYGEFINQWEFPGGKIETGESREEALHREIMEELNVAINIKDFLITINYDYPNFHLTMHCYFCSIKTGTPVFREHNAAAWVTKEELDTFQWLPADLEIIEELKKVL